MIWWDSKTSYIKLDIWAKINTKDTLLWRCYSFCLSNMITTVALKGRGVNIYYLAIAT